MDNDPLPTQSHTHFHCVQQNHKITLHWHVTWAWRIQLGPVVNMWLEHVQFATTTLPELGTHEGAHSYSYSRYPIEQNVNKLLIYPQEVWVIPQPQPFFWSPDLPCLPLEPSQDLDCLHINTYHTEDRYQVYILFNVRISILPTILHKWSEIQSYTLSLEFLHPLLSSIEGVLPYHIQHMCQQF